MSNDEVRIKCADCGTALMQSDKECPKCGSVKKSFMRKMHDQVSIKNGTALRQKRKGFKRFVLEMIDRRRSSKDPKLEQGVQEIRIINKEKDEYHHVVKDEKTGKIIHEEHEPLTKHNTKEV